MRAPLRATAAITVTLVVVLHAALAFLLAAPKLAAAAALLGVHQPRVSDLMRGRVDLFSTDTLVDMLARLGVRVRVTVVSPKPRKRTGAA